MAAPPTASPARAEGAAAARAIGERRVRVRAPGEPRRVAYLYIAPAFLFYLLFAFGPLVYTTWLSFFDWDGLTVGTWVGIENYRTVLEDPDVRSSFVHAFELIFFYAILPVALGLGLASVIAHGRVRGVTFFRAVLFLPQTIASVVVAIAWVWIYAPRGPLNEGLRAVGLGSVARGWLGDFDFALPALGLVGTWVMFGLCLILFLAGIQRIPISRPPTSTSSPARPRARRWSTRSRCRPRPTAPPSRATRWARPSRRAGTSSWRTAG